LVDSLILIVDLDGELDVCCNKFRCYNTSND